MANTIKIDRVKKNDNGVIRFTLIYNNVNIYGCRIATADDGRKFVAFPSYKGNDDKYYNYVYVKLSDEETISILNKIDAIFNAE